ncbi:hypothetical protein CFC21_055740 [Triticum aestivum]|uniref:Sucrose:sucrose 1-fructosyltransferase n=2 Tax=Triticum aestivum TaxID=4565 RepID=A0A9R1GFU4_WHEAT|nr:sucrose:sucrose 1-fructosyltransferase-like [Triticum aestivum]KAF7046737.1 hypothetical protein CFC21_055740 [Triticum aestivum]
MAPRDRRTTRSKDFLLSSGTAAVAVKSPGAVPDTPPVPFAYGGLLYQQSGGRRRWRECTVVLGAVAMVALFVTHALLPRASVLSEETRGEARAEQNIMVTAGADADGFPWSNEMLQWQRTGFHFQPEKNYMNDPNAPMYYRGRYHFFYQYNPTGVVWGNITWGHAVSRDLIHWRHLPLAMVPDQWYDIHGVLTGSATILPNGTVIVLYTGKTDTSAQVQCLALPADPDDPLLVNWTKHPANPVILPPPGIGLQDFRDPTTAWFDESDLTWRTLIGSKDDNGHAGIALMYKTKDFIRYELIPGVLHRVEGTGMWECVDFYPVGGSNNSSEEALYVLKASMDDERHDYYALGRYDAATNTWTPLDPELDVGIGLRYDWGKFFAATSFYDPVKRRRVMWAYVGETDSLSANVAKGWASVQTIPRTVVLDEKTRTNLLQWPVEEIETLRFNSTDYGVITIHTGSIIPLRLRQATQLDIEASFRLDTSAIAIINEANVNYNCSTSGGASTMGPLGPFGFLIHAAGNGGSEQLAVYFYVSRGLDGALRTHFCHDELLSSRANDVMKRVVGSTVPVLDGEALSVRVLVDHSIVESFAMGGRLTATSRVYPMEAIHTAAGVYLFNNATGSSITVEKLVVHEMASALYNQTFVADDD